MKYGERMLLCTLAGVAFCAAAGAIPAEPSGSPYQGIVDRNVFGLKAPAPPPDPEANKPPPPKIFLTGITTILGNKRALMKMTPPAKPGEPAKEQSFTLGEGQRDGDLEVLEIDEVKRTVKVDVYGSVTTLDFDNNGVKSAAAAPAPAAGPHPPGFVPRPGMPGFNPQNLAPAGPTARPLRLPTPNASAGSGAPGITPVYANTTSGYAPPPNYASAVPGVGAVNSTVPLNGSTPAQNQAASGATSQMTADQRFLMVEAYRAKLAQEGRTLSVPPIPATPFTSELNPGAAGTPAGGTTTPTPTGPPLAPTIPRPLPPTQ